MGQVEGISHLRDEDEQVAPEVRRPSVASSGARDQQDGTRETHDDAQGTAWRDAFMQQEGGQDKGEDGHRCQLDSRIDGRRETQSHDVAALGQREAKEACSRYLEEIASLDALLRHNERSEPEEQCRPDDAERHQLRSRDAATGEHVLGERRHQPEQHHGQQHRPVGRPVLITL